MAATNIAAPNAAATGEAAQLTLPADTAADTGGADSLKLGARSRACGRNWLLNRKPEISSPARDTDSVDEEVSKTWPGCCKGGMQPVGGWSGISAS